MTPTLRIRNRRTIALVVVLAAAGAVATATAAPPAQVEPAPGDCVAHVTPVYFGRGSSEVTAVECEPPREDANRSAAPASP